jgi:cation diffusion facilitator CzcD-associated flavoprotein CzcO
MKLNTKVVEARFQPREGIWNIVLEDVTTGTRTTDWAHVLINGTGVLNSWKWPDIQGLHTFQGPLIHSAKWDHAVEFSNKTIGIIGTGTSSVQIIPRLQQTCKKMSVFMRSPTWVSPPFGAGVMEKHLTQGAPVSASQRQYNFTEADRKRFRDDPSYHLEFRKEIEAEINGLFGLYRQKSEMSLYYKGLIEKEMRRYAGLCASFADVKLTIS